MKIETLLAAALAVGVMTSLSSAKEPSYRDQIAQSSSRKAASDAGKKGEETSPNLLRDLIRGGVGNSAEAKRRTAEKEPADTKNIDRTTTSSVETKTKTKTVTSKSVRTSGSGNSYHTIISQYASAYGVPVSLAAAVVRIESNYRVNARGRAGEVGLMQIKPSTARAMGYSGSLKGLYHPETNIKYGMKYLGLAHKLGGGSTCGTILKYNAGHGAKRMNKTSAAYCAKVKRILGQ